MSTESESKKGQRVARRAALRPTARKWRARGYTLEEIGHALGVSVSAARCWTIDVDAAPETAAIAPIGHAGQPRRIEMGRTKELEKQIAYHEAGHAAAVFWIGWDLNVVTIDAGESTDDNPGTRYAPPLPRRIRGKPTREKPFRSRMNEKRAREEIIICSAGFMAVAILRGDPEVHYEPRDSQDLSRIMSLREKYGISDKELRSLWSETEAVLSEPQNWQFVEAIAAALLRERKLTMDEVVQIKDGFD